MICSTVCMLPVTKPKAHGSKCRSATQSGSGGTGGGCGVGQPICTRSQQKAFCVDLGHSSTMNDDDPQMMLRPTPSKNSRCILRSQRRAMARPSVWNPHVAMELHRLKCSKRAEEVTRAAEVRFDFPATTQQMAQPEVRHAQLVHACRDS